MKTIGLLGGMSWESSLLYYQWLNEGVRERLGGLHSAKILMSSVDFASVAMQQKAGDWQGAARDLSSEAEKLQQAGAELLLLCTNTMHKVADSIEAVLHIPFLHIADATAERVAEQGLRKVALLGTQFTMSQPFYQERLQARGLQVLTPEAEDAAHVHRIIYEELCLGEVTSTSREIYQSAIDRLQDRGAEGVILGCTEITMLIKPEHVELPVFDTTRIHVEAALDMALSSSRVR